MQGGAIREHLDEGEVTVKVVSDIRKVLVDEGGRIRLGFENGVTSVLRGGEAVIEVGVVRAETRNLKGAVVVDLLQLVRSK